MYISNKWHNNCGRGDTSLKIKSKKKWGGKIIILFRLVFNSKYVHLKKLNISFFKTYHWKFCMAVQYRNSKIHPKSAMYSSIVKIPWGRDGAVFKKRLACFLTISELESEDISWLFLVIPFSLLSHSHRLCFETRNSHSSV